MTLDDEIEDNPIKFEVKKEEIPDKKYVKFKNPYTIPSPDYLFLLVRIEEISDGTSQHRA